MYSQIVERTPSIYFKFDDQNQRNFSKSSFALDYSISNQKHLLSNNRFGNRFKSSSNTQNKQDFIIKQQSYSPVRNNGSNLKDQTHIHKTIEHSTTKPHFQHQQQQQQDDEFMRLHRCLQPSPSNNNKQSTKLKTQDFFQEFDQKYSFTFEDDIHTHEFIPEAEYEGGSKISRGYLEFEEFQVDQVDQVDQVEETMKLIQIESRKDILLGKTQSVSCNSLEDANRLLSSQSSEIHQANDIAQINSSNAISFVKTHQNIFSSHVTISDNDNDHTNNKKKIKNPQLSNERSDELFSTEKENKMKNQETEFEEVISFGPTNTNNKTKKYKALNTRHFITKDFENNSSLFEKSKPIIQPKRRVPFKNIENLIQKNAKDQTRSQTRKKPIINTDLLVSTINKTEKNQAKQTNGVWSNPINTKKSSSLQCTFSYDNMFKTNAFRETLKSTTLENWRKKHHQKIEHLGERRTVCKKHRDRNIFENLFIRA